MLNDTLIFKWTFACIVNAYGSCCAPSVTSVLVVFVLLSWTNMRPSTNFLTWPLVPVPTTLEEQPMRLFYVRPVPAVQITSPPEGDPRILVSLYSLRAGSMNELPTVPMRLWVGKWKRNYTATSTGFYVQWINYPKLAVNFSCTWKTLNILQFYFSAPGVNIPKFVVAV